MRSEPILPQGFEKDDGDAVGEVERAGVGVEHGEVEPAVAVAFEELGGEAGGFASEDKIVIGSESGVSVSAGAVGFDEPEAGGRGKLLFEVGPVFPAMPGEVLPVVHARAFQLFVVELKSEGLDEVQGSVSGGTEPGDVAGVRRNLGLEKDDVHS